MSLARKVRMLPGTRSCPEAGQYSKKPAWMRVLYFGGEAAASGFLTGIGWKFESLGWMGIAGISLFLWSQFRQSQWNIAAVQAWIMGIASFVTACPWIPSTVVFLSELDFRVSLLVSGAFYGLMATQLAGFSIIWFWFRTRFQNGWLAAPAIWIVLDQIWPTLFPWPAACLLDGSLALLQLAEIGGVHMVSVATLAIAGFIAWSGHLTLGLVTGKRGRRGPSLVLWPFALLMILALWFWGANRVRSIEKQGFAGNGDEFRIGLVQADTGFVDSNERMVSISRQFGPGVDLIVWPESALGDYSREIRDFSDAEFVAEHSVGEDTRFVPYPNPQCYLLAGADTWEHSDFPSDIGKPRHFVSALLIDAAEKLVGRHDKVSLMPYGEYIPGESLLPFLRSWFGSDRVITPGTSLRTIGAVRDVPLGVLLCCEDLRSPLARSMVNDGARLLVTLGNGMAFDSRLPLMQHFRIARWRAIENRISFLRCTSSGVSALIAPTGRIVRELPMMHDNSCLLSLPKSELSPIVTVYSRTGDLLVNLLVFVLLLGGMSGGALVPLSRFPQS